MTQLDFALTTSIWGNTGPGDQVYNFDQAVITLPKIQSMLSSAIGAKDAAAVMRTLNDSTIHLGVDFAAGGADFSFNAGITALTFGPRLKVDLKGGNLGVGLCLNVNEVLSSSGTDWNKAPTIKTADWQQKSLHLNTTGLNIGDSTAQLLLDYGISAHAKLSASAYLDAYGVKGSVSGSINLPSININESLPLSKPISGNDFFDMVKVAVAVAAKDKDLLQGSSGEAQVSTTLGKMTLGIPSAAKADSLQGAVAGHQFGSFQMDAVSGDFINGELKLFGVLETLGQGVYEFDKSIGLFGYNAEFSAVLAQANLSLAGKMEQDFVFTPQSVGVVMTSSFGEIRSGALGDPFAFTNTPQGEGSFGVDAVYTVKGRVTRTDYLRWEESLDLKFLEFNIKLDLPVWWFDYDYGLHINETIGPAYDDSITLGVQKIQLGDSHTYDYTLPSITKHYTLTYENFYTGSSGNDTFTLTTHQTSVDGGAGNDSITGNSLADSILGGYGNDVLVGGVGADTLLGGVGNDTLRGNGGKDSMAGGAGDDSLVGGDGNDTLLGEDGNDTLAGGSGSDSLNGGTGNDLLSYADNTAAQGISLNATNETMLGGNDGLGGTDRATGFESILGGAGNDSINADGYTAPLTLQGNTGNDSLMGGSGNDMLLGGSGNDTLAGGSGNDSLDGGDGTDSFVAGRTAALSLAVLNGVLTGNDGNNSTDILASIEVILGGGFNDSIDAEGLGTNLTLQGNSGDDSLAGTSGNDSLDGGDGSDTLAGHAGVDLLTGGDGADLFSLVFLNSAVIPNWSTLGATDTIADFSSAWGDKLDLNNGLGIFTNADGSPVRLTWHAPLSGTVASLSLGLALSSVEGSGSEGVFFQAATLGGGWLIVDTDRSGTLTAGDLVERLLGGAGFTLAKTDFVAGTFSGTITEGTSGNDTIIGATGGDTLLGLAGNDSLRGKGGDDMLSGGDGNDTLTGGGGRDTLEGGAGDDSLIGTSGATETMFGGLGNDTMDGTAGNQLVSFAEYTASQPLRLRAVDGVTLVSTDGLQPVSTAVRIDTLISIETIIGGAGNDTMTGLKSLYASSLRLYGGGGDDILIGGSAADTLVGGTGNDSLDGGKGNDSLDGGDGIDAYFGGSDTGLNLHGYNGALVGADGYRATDTLRNIEVVAGNQFADVIDATGINTNMTLAGAGGDDTLTGSTGNDCLDGGDGNDLLDGTGGNNTLLGGAGDDTYIVNATTEVLVEEFNAGLDKVRSSVTWTLGDNFEQLVLTGTADIDGTGNGLDNTLDGNAGSNLLSGQDGNDSLGGQDGNDTLLGDDGNDTLDGGNGADSLDGGAGNDLLLGYGGAPNVFFNPDNQHFYQLVTNRMEDWATALTYAASLSVDGQQGYLATVTSASEQGFISDLIGDNWFWIGASDAASAGQWQWRSKSVV